MKNFEVGKHIKEFLDVPSVRKYLKGKIFPLIANEGTDFPFLVYRRASYVPENTKDYEDEKVTIEIVIAANTYVESLDIANSVADALNGKEDDLISDITIQNLYEDYADDTFLQYITIQVSIK